MPVDKGALSYTKDCHRRRSRQESSCASNDERKRSGVHWACCQLTFRCRSTCRPAVRHQRRKVQFTALERLITLRPRLSLPGLLNRGRTSLHGLSHVSIPPGSSTGRKELQKLCQSEGVANIVLQRRPCQHPPVTDNIGGSRPRAARGRSSCPGLFLHGSSSKLRCRDQNTFHRQEAGA